MGQKFSNGMRMIDHLPFLIRAKNLVPLKNPSQLVQVLSRQKHYQLLSYKDDVDLRAKLAEWEAFYNFARPHGAHGEKTPYESLREKLL